jgi:hypothetical protein
MALTLSGILICGILLSTPAFSSNPQISTPTANIMNDASSAPVSFAQIPATAPEIAFSFETVKVTIKREAGLDEIRISSNCPNHWNVSSSVVRQVALSSTSKGVSVRADATGAQAIVNGQIYQLPRGSDGAVHSLKIENGQVIINGQKLSPIAGSDVPGGCTGPDVLEVRVPESYKGGLLLSCHGASDVNLDSWMGGSVMISLHGSGNVNTGKLQNLSKAVFDVDGTGKAEIKGLTAKALVANINGAGSVLVNGGSADLSNATISGSGSIKLKGSFKNLKKSVNGSGSIQVLE